MDRIAIFSDVHANITALNAVLDDIYSRGISRIYCLGDSVTKCCNPDLVIDTLRKTCEVVLKGNCDEVIASPNAKARAFWSRLKIGEERAQYLNSLPVLSEFYMSGRLVRLFHASPYSLSHIYNPMFSNKDTLRETIELDSPLKLFDNTEFLGKGPNDAIPDIVGYGHIHTPNILRYENKMIFNVGSVGMPIEMANDKNLFNENNRFSTLASYIILEGIYGSKDLSSLSITLVRVPYDIQKEIAYLELSDMPGKENAIKFLKTASSN